MHVTLAFLGEQPTERLETLESIAARAASATGRGTLALSTAGSFGSKRAPRVLWIGLAGDVERLRGLQQRLAQSLAEEDFPVEEREFSPHITLARRRPAAIGAAPAGWPPHIEATSFEMRELTLFESRLSPRGATYVAVRTFELGG